MNNLGQIEFDPFVWPESYTTGCTPLHWAAIKGNLDSCTVLGQALKKLLLITMVLLLLSLLLIKVTEKLQFSCGQYYYYCNCKFAGNFEEIRIQTEVFTPLLYLHVHFE